MMPSLGPADDISKLVRTATRLRIDAGAADVIGRFELAGVRALLLKGPSIAQWLYTEADPRAYVDCDLLIAPSDLEVAGEVLGSLSYSCRFDEQGMPSWWREHAGVWLRESDGLTIDLHRTLPGVRVDDDAAWRMLSADADVVVVAGRQVPTLGLPARALHVSLHAAQHGAGWARPMADLARALRAADDDVWREAAALAAELEATDALVAGLRLTAAGAQLARRLQLPGTRSTDAELRASSPPPLALGFEQLARAQGVRLRMEIVWRKLVPPPAFIRHWDPRAAHGGLALLRAYLRRPIWLLCNAPRGLRAWHRARRSVRGAGRGDQR